MTFPSDVNEGINQALSNGADAIKAPVETVGDERVSGTVEGHGIRASVCETRQPVTPDVKNGRSEYRASPADSQVLEVADMDTGNAPVKDSPLVGRNSGVSTSARVDAPEVSHVYLLSSEIVSLVEADRRTAEELEEVGR